MLVILFILFILSRMFGSAGENGNVFACKNFRFEDAVTLASGLLNVFVEYHYIIITLSLHYHYIVITLSL